jgi:hypothetical protein
MEHGMALHLTTAVYGRPKKEITALLRRYYLLDYQL